MEHVFTMLGMLFLMLLQFPQVLLITISELMLFVAVLLIHEIKNNWQEKKNMEREGKGSKKPEGEAHSTEDAAM